MARSLWCLLTTATTTTTTSTMISSSLSFSSSTIKSSYSVPSSSSRERAASKSPFAFLSLIFLVGICVQDLRLASGSRCLPLSQNKEDSVSSSLRQRGTRSYSLAAAPPTREPSAVGRRRTPNTNDRKLLISPGAKHSSSSSSLSSSEESVNVFLHDKKSPLSFSLLVSVAASSLFPTWSATLLGSSSSSSSSAAAAAGEQTDVLLHINKETSQLGGSLSLLPSDAEAGLPRSLQESSNISEWEAPYLEGEAMEASPNHTAPEKNGEEEEEGETVTVSVEIVVFTVAGIVVFVVVFCSVRFVCIRYCQKYSSVRTRGATVSNFSHLANEIPLKLLHRRLRQAAGLESNRVKGDEDGVGDVYRAYLRVGGCAGDVAVKRLRGDFTQRGGRGLFVSELVNIARGRYRNLCKPIAYSMAAEEAMVVYPFNAMGSLRDLLGPGTRSKERRRRAKAEDHPAEVVKVASFSQPPDLLLDWPARVLIVKQIAVALRHLHVELHPPLLHRNVKSSNVLIERGADAHKKPWRAYLTDFGFRSACSWTTDEQKTRDRFGITVGATGGADERDKALTVTDGYKPPEQQQGSNPVGGGGGGAADDIYAFGVVLLEVVTGRMALFLTEEEELMPLAQWCRRWLGADSHAAGQAAVREIIDPRILDKLNEPQWRTLYDIAWLGLDCTKDDPRQRPNTQQMVDRLLSVIG